MPSEAAIAQFLKNPEVWRIFFPPDFESPADKNPNYVAPDHGKVVVVVAILSIILSSIVVLSRLVSRLYVIRSFKLDDWLIIPGLLTHIASCATVIWAAHNAGLGKHVYDNTAAEISNWYIAQYAASVTQLSGIFIARLSIIVFLISLAGNAEPKSRRALICVLVANLILWPASLLPFVFMCVPEFRMWSLLKLVSSGCVRQRSKSAAVQRNSVVLGIVGVVLDFAILTIPIQLVWRLRLPIRQRLIVSVLFGIGSLACIAAVCKAVYTARELSENSKSIDLSWTSVPIFLSGILEQLLGLVAACGPAMKPLLSRVFHLASTIYGRSKLTGSGHPSPGYSRGGRGSVGVTRWTIGGSGKKSKVAGKYDMESIAITGVDSRSSIIEMEESGERQEGNSEPGREEI